MKKKQISILKIFRQIQGYTLKKTEEKSGIHKVSLYNYERGKYIPPRKSIIKLAKALNINSDIIFYSFGCFGEAEIEIIRSDPFYYMEKIKELCHNNKYKDEEINSAELNRLKAFDYLKK